MYRMDHGDVRPGATNRENLRPESTAASPRRSVLKAFAATGAIARLGSVASAQEDEDSPTTIVLGGRVEYWFGVAPEQIEGEENPTLQLRAEDDYEIVWTNMDGQPHEIAVLDGDDDEVEAAGEEVEEVGGTQRLEFTATEDMQTYLCTVHPDTQVGDVEIGDGFGAEDDQ